MKHPSLQDPWSRTLAMLEIHASRPPERSAARACSTPALVQRAAPRRTFGVDQAQCVSIRVLERLSESTLALSWHDPTSFNYSEQVWALCTARKGGTCALSGQSIRRGQPVYRPRRVGSSMPLNSGAMILPLALTLVQSAQEETALGV
jgi:hypothetical protein